MKINKTFMAEEIKVVDQAQGIIEAYVNTMGKTDKDGDIIEPTAFEDSISNNLPIPVLSGHDHANLIGKVIMAEAIPVKFNRKNEHQLYAKMQMNMETQAGREAFSNVAGEFVREWSVGFNIPNPDVDIEYSKQESGNTVRRIKNLDWVEVSTVVRGASPTTATISAKSDIIIEPNEQNDLESADDTATDTIDEVALDAGIEHEKNRARIKSQIVRSRLKMEIINNNPTEG